jgi:thiol-disulfide isomerase/thioredoxin/uncharacterized membrane protein YphA (DoxX/SURF4 family)
MDVLLLILRLALGGVFLVAALAKITDRAGTRRAIEGFGVPARWSAPSALVLPVAELAVAGCLLVPGTVRAGAIASLGLLTLFTVAIAANLARGRRPDCHCFGQMRSKPIGRRTLARNGVLIVVATLVLMLGLDDPGPGAVSWIADLSGTGALALALGVFTVVVLMTGSWVAMHLLRQHGRLMLRIDRLETALAAGGLDLGDHEHLYEMPALGLPVGDPAPGFELASEGGTADLASFIAAGKPALLLFTDAGCGPCQELLPEVAGWQVRHHEELTIAVLASGERDATLAKAAEHELSRVFMDPERMVAEAFLASATPAAVLVAPDGTIAAPLAEGAEHIRRLLAAGVGWEQPAEQGRGIGEEALPLVLTDLDGASVAMADRLASDGATLVVFWNPGCGYCRDMHADLLAYEGGAGDGRPPLLVLSAGEPDEVRAEGFSSVLLDPDFTAASAFGASGTPMGLLLGADGRIVSRLAAGGTAVFDLARSFHL